MSGFLDIRMHDGSRHFAELPQTVSWDRLFKHIKKLSGVTDANLLTDNVTEAWIDFSYRGHQFSVNNQFGNYWLFVQDPDCPVEVLEAVVSHCKVLLGESVESSDRAERLN
jgi:hypothetical protein